MRITELSLPGVLLIAPKGFDDHRGTFYESFRHDVLVEALGRPYEIRQSNYSISRRGVLRGIHGVRGKFAQAKVVSCVRGSVIDIVIDLRVGSPTFGQHEMVMLNQRSPASIYIAEGLGHSFLALEDDTAMHYNCSQVYIPEDVYTVDALDPALALPWGLTEAPIRSDVDAGAASVEEALATKLLPTYDECLELYGRR